MTRIKILKSEVEKKIFCTKTLKNHEFPLVYLYNSNKFMVYLQGLYFNKRHQNLNKNQH